MRYTSILILTLFSLAASAQYDSAKVRQYQGGYGQSQNSLEVRAAFVPPRFDTVKLAIADTGAVAYLNRKYYSWQKRGTLLKWWDDAFGGGGTAGVFLTGTSTLNLDTANANLKKYIAKYGLDSANLIFNEQGVTGTSIVYPFSNQLFGRTVRDSSGIAITTAPDGAVVFRATNATGWSRTGSAVSSNDSIFGTTTNNAIRIIANNVDVGAITRAGQFIWGATTPPESYVWKFQVNGSIYANDTITIRKPGGAPFRLFPSSSTVARLQVGFTANYDFDNAGKFTASSIQSAGSLQTPNYYAWGSGSTLTNANSFQNNGSTVWTITNVNPVATTGTSYNRLLYLNKLSQRGSQDGPEEALRINFTVTGTATDRRAITVDDGRTILTSLQRAISIKTSAYTTTDNDNAILADATAGAFNVTLQSAVGRGGIEYVIKKTDSSGNAVTVATTSSQTIDGSTTYSLATQYKYVVVRSDGANWQIVGGN